MPLTVSLVYPKRNIQKSIFHHKKISKLHDTCIIILDPFVKENGLTYPINVLRNVARSNAETYYVMSSDIELYPSANMTNLFLGMMQKLRKNNTNRMVFVLPVFEVLANETVPTSKTQLV